MKRTIAAAILGIAAVTNCYAAGSVYFDNYLAGTYNQVVWDPQGTYLPGLAVTSPIQMQLYYAEGVVSDFNQLTAGVVGAINPMWDYYGAAGAGGWFTGPLQVLPTWLPGDTFTFAAKVISPGYSGTTPLWQEFSAIHFTQAVQTGFWNFPGLVVHVPEPSTFGLAAIGAIGVLNRRRVERSKP